MGKLNLTKDQKTDIVYNYFIYIRSLRYKDLKEGFEDHIRGLGLNDVPAHHYLKLEIEKIERDLKEEFYLNFKIENFVKKCMLWNAEILNQDIDQILEKRIKELDLPIEEKEQCREQIEIGIIESFVVKCHTKEFDSNAEKMAKFEYLVFLKSYEVQSGKKKKKSSLAKTLLVWIGSQEKLEVLYNELNSIYIDEISKDLFFNHFKGIAGDQPINWKMGVYDLIYLLEKLSNFINPAFSQKYASNIVKHFTFKGEYKKEKPLYDAKSEHPSLNATTKTLKKLKDISDLIIK